MPGTICFAGAHLLALQQSGRHLCRRLLPQQQGLQASERLPGRRVGAPLPACPSRSMPPGPLGPLQDYALACSEEQGMCLSHQEPHLPLQIVLTKVVVLRTASMQPAPSGQQTSEYSRAHMSPEGGSKSLHEGCPKFLTWQVACASQTLRET